MDIYDLKTSKETTEKHLKAMISTAINIFEQETECSISSISVSLSKVNEISKNPKPSYYVNDVKITIEL